MTKAPVLKNDCFALPPGVHWTPVDEALSMLRERLHCIVPAQETPLADLAGRILAKDVVAERAHPPLPNSAVDGYGFHGALAPGEHRLPLVKGRAAAGGPFDGKVPAGNAIRVLTGAPLPDGVTTIALQEDVSVEDGDIHLRGPLKEGANARSAGEDMQVGQSILPKGRRITPADIGTMASVGVAAASAYRKLRVAIISTGDELVPPDVQAKDGQIFDANRPMLSALIRAWGFEVIDFGIQPDNAEQVQRTLSDAATAADVILTSGGASAGDEDHVSAALNSTGSMALWRVAIKPGRPLALGIWNGTPVFGLPGNPVAAFVCTLVFGRPAMLQMAGASFQNPTGMMVPAAFEKAKKNGRREYLRARLGKAGAEVFPSEGSGRISGLTWANGLVELPDEAVDVTHGTLVKYIPFSEFGI